MSATLLFVIVGALLLVMGVTTTYIKRLPVTTAIIYFAAGYAMDPAGLSFAAFDPVRRPHTLERITEVAVLVSLFAAGLKLRAPFGGPLRDRRWQTPVRLATVSMVLTAAGVAALGRWGLGLPLGAAVLLGGVLAPTDPVLASDVQVEHAEDRDRLRFALTGEAGLNDGTAFPIVMLGLGLLGLHDLGAGWWKWLAVDVAWAVVAGVGVGVLCGTAVGRLVLRLRATYEGRMGGDDLIAVGLIGLAYGLALLAKGYGFLAVFAAGLALRRAEERHAERVGEKAPLTVAADASDEASQQYMVANTLGAVEQVERVGEAAVLLLLGGLFSGRFVAPEALWFAAALFLVVRPASVWLGGGAHRAGGNAGEGTRPAQRRLAMWFGIRGIGSVYYLTYAAAHGLPAPLTERLAAITFTVIVASLVVHGVSVTPLMRRYDQRAKRRGNAESAPATG